MMVVEGTCTRNFKNKLRTVAKNAIITLADVMRTKEGRAQHLICTHFTFTRLYVLHLTYPRHVQQLVSDVAQLVGRCMHRNRRDVVRVQSESLQLHFLQLLPIGL